MKKLILIALLSVLTAAAARAQIKVDIVTLSGGKALKGSIVEKTDSSIFFKSADGTLSKEIGMEDISSIGSEMFTRQQYKQIGGYVRGNYPPSSRKKGYGAYLELAGATGFGTGNSIFMTTSHGYFINPKIFVGGGAGISMAWPYSSGPDVIRSTYMYVPVFANARFYFLNSKKCSPFIDAKIGYAIPVYDSVLSLGYDSGYSYSAGRVQGMYADISAGVELGHITLAIGLIGRNYQSIDYRSEIDGMWNRWHNYSSSYAEMEGTFHFSIGYRF